MSTQITSFTIGALAGVHDGTLASLIEVAIRVTGLAKELSPYLTSRLRGSIMWIVGAEEGGFGTDGSPDQNDLIRISTVDKDGIITGIVGTIVPYAVYQEFGTRLDGGIPFLRPAILVITKGLAASSAIRDIMVGNMRLNLKNNARRYTV